MVDELRASMFWSLLEDELPASCEECGGAPLECDQPFVLTTRGELFDDLDHPERSVIFHACPRSYDHWRSLGGDVVPLAEVVRWGIERGGHQDPTLPASSARLMREYTAIRELPGIIGENKAYRLQEERAKAEDLRRGF